jgi:hypothetical protein
MPDQRAFKAMDEAGIDVQFLNFTYASTATLHARREAGALSRHSVGIQHLSAKGGGGAGAIRVSARHVAVGRRRYVRERVQAYRDAGVTCLNIDIPEFVEEPATLVEKLRSWVNA